ncbi:hypothetical protein PVK06_024253 [Gossypium arboreum]|uniref:Uncharacterized protein n=1 Tax=Gossypium arboreum TaxID=29729 RepID=A0ABR0PD99_GOSAR|nr:hypothetical protein PVK06_024253 [Gossypium arboreum]
MIGYTSGTYIDISPISLSAYYSMPFYKEEDLSSLDFNNFTSIHTDTILNYLTNGGSKWKRKASLRAGVDIEQT